MDAHLHSTRDCYHLTGLYRQSTVLAACGAIPEDPAAAHVPDDYILASDPSLQRIKGPPAPGGLQQNPCALPPGSYALLIPAPHRLV